MADNSEQGSCLAEPSEQEIEQRKEYRSLRLSFEHLPDENPSARAKCRAFWTYVASHPEFDAMLVPGHPKRPPESAAAKSITSGKMGNGEGDSSQTVRREDRPWQRRLAALQALGLDRVAAAAEWRGETAVMAAPEGWPTPPEQLAAAAQRRETQEAARRRLADREHLLRELRTLPRPDALPGPALLPYNQQIYRVMPQIRLPPPDEEEEEFPQERGPCGGGPCPAQPCASDVCVPCALTKHASTTPAQAQAAPLSSLPLPPAMSLRPQRPTSSKRRTRDSQNVNQTRTSWSWSMAGGSLQVCACCGCHPCCRAAARPVPEARLPAKSFRSVAVGPSQEMLPTEPSQQDREESVVAANDQEELIEKAPHPSAHSLAAVGSSSAESATGSSSGGERSGSLRAERSPRPATPPPSDRDTLSSSDPALVSAPAADGPVDPWRSVLLDVVKPRRERPPPPPLPPPQPSVYEGEEEEEEEEEEDATPPAPPTVLPGLFVVPEERPSVGGVAVQAVPPSPKSPPPSQYVLPGPCLGSTPMGAATGESSLLSDDGATAPNRPGWRTRANRKDVPQPSLERLEGQYVNPCCQPGWSAQRERLWRGPPLPLGPPSTEGPLSWAVTEQRGAPRGGGTRPLAPHDALAPPHPDAASTSVALLSEPPRKKDTTKMSYNVETPRELSSEPRADVKDSSPAVICKSKEQSGRPLRRRTSGPTKGSSLQTAQDKKSSLSTRQRHSTKAKESEGISSQQQRPSAAEGKAQSLAPRPRAPSKRQSRSLAAARQTTSSPLSQ